MSSSTAAISTKDKLLEAASRLFSQRGFDATSVRDICLEAGVNNALVNYHFGDKRSLYHAVIERELANSQWYNPPPEELEPKEKLRWIVERSLEDVFRRDNFVRSSNRELLDPTEELMDMLKGPLESHFQGLLEVIRELSTGRLTDDQLRLTALGVTAQIQFHLFSPKFVPYLIGEEMASRVDVELLADHITGSTLRSLGRQQ